MERLRNSNLKIVTPNEQKALLIAWDMLTGIVGFSTKPKLILGKENIPAKAPYIVASNHRGIVEPAVLLHTFNRWIYFMAKHETFDMPIIGKLISSAGMFPVRRGELDRAALKKAVDYLNSGQVVGIMPEGTRGRSDLTDFNAFKKGTAWVATMAGKVPIVPVGITGPEDILALIEEQSLSKTWQEILSIRTGKTKPIVNLSIGKPIVDYPKDRSVLTDMIFKGISEQVSKLENSLP